MAENLHGGDEGRADMRADLHAKVEALSGYPPFGDHPGAWVLRDEVLALFDGSSDDQG